MSKLKNILNTFVYSRYLTTAMNTFSMTRLYLAHYRQIVLYSSLNNLVTSEILYPLLMGVLQHKVIVLVILSFI